MEFLDNITLDSLPQVGYNEIDFPNTLVTSETFANNQLDLFNGEQLVAKLNIIRDFNSGNFALGSLTGGGTAVKFIPPAPPVAVAGTGTPWMKSMMLPIPNTLPVLKTSKE